MKQYDYLWKDDYKSFGEYLYEEGVELYNVMVHQSRWTITHEIVVYLKELDKYFMYYLEANPTEHNDYWEIKDKCFEVEQKEVLMKKWVKKK